jgi:haloalkane dehalogenase
MGRSNKPIKEQYYTYDRHCENILTFINTFGLTNITPFIQDRGSLIGTRVIRENPDLFARVVLVNGDLPLMTEGVKSIIYT